MHFVYILSSLSKSNQHYVGCTTDLEQRLKEHNSGRSAYTKTWMPWEIMSYVAFKSKDNAFQFEKYLKSGSGYAFFRKRLI